MKTLVIGSSSKSSGKTGVILGLNGALGKKAGYMKPLGDRLIYQKKRLWDYDSALLTNLWNLQEHPEDLSIGFEHAKLRYKYDAETIVEKLREVASRTGVGKEILFVEGGMHLGYGLSVNLDAVSVAKALDGELVMVISGSEGTVADDMAFIKVHLNLNGVKFKGVIINQIHDLEDFNASTLPSLSKLGIPILGTLPYQSELSRFTMRFVADILFSKILAGEENLDNEVEHIVIGAMAVGSALRETVFTREKKLLITSGDRTDMILAALDSGTSGIILTNNILPQSSVVARASELKIPLLLVSLDTFLAAKQVDDREPLLTRHEPKKVELWKRLVKEHVDLGKFQ
jgi:uncharacterized protein